TTYEPKNAKWFRFLEREEDILELYKKADVIVAHAGAGTLLTALSFGKPIVVVPRLKKFGEHVDDQQLELAEALENMNKAIAVYDIEKLEDAIKKAKLLLKYRPIQRNKKLILFLKSTLRRLEK
ncbi:beta-1,4-galactosyltransferase, partial [Thermococcus sp. LS1]